MERFWETVGLITRWVLVVVACWWFFVFLTGIGSRSDRAQELAGYALGKALLCGVIAAIWFYRAKGEKQGKALSLFIDSELKARQLAPEEQAPKTEPPQASHPSAIERPLAIGRLLERKERSYCIGCGSALPNGAQFCPLCGKGNVLDQASFNPAPPDLPVEPEKTNEYNGKLHEQESKYSPLFSAATIIEPGARLRLVNAGSIILSVVALICLILGVIQSFIPVFIVEGAAFAGLAWYCAAKWPLSEQSSAAMLAVAILLAGFVGVTLNKNTFGSRYRYLSQGSAQYRIDEKAGRTDRLGSGGWIPVAYDNDAQALDLGSMGYDILFKVNLTNGSWEPSIAGGNVCFFATNSSDYVLQAIDIELAIQNSSDTSTKQTDADGFPIAAAGGPIVKLQNEVGGLIPPGGTYQICGPAPRALSPGETWSYTLKQIYGWKK